MQLDDVKVGMDVWVTLPWGEKGWTNCEATVIAVRQDIHRKGVYEVRRVTVRWKHPPPIPGAHVSDVNTFEPWALRRIPPVMMQDEFSLWGATA